MKNYKEMNGGFGMHDYVSHKQNNIIYLATWPSTVCMAFDLNYNLLITCATHPSVLPHSTLDLTVDCP